MMKLELHKDWYIFFLENDDVTWKPRIGSLSTRTFQGDATVVERLRLGRVFLRMTSPGLPTSSCRRRREASWFGGVSKQVRDLAVFNVFIVSSPFSSGWYDFHGRSANVILFCFIRQKWPQKRLNPSNREWNFISLPEKRKFHTYSILKGEACTRGYFVLYYLPAGLFDDSRALLKVPITLSQLQ